ncbi:MAG: UDP-N-acetylglucosamine--N-acetylmuramyl-(pentapeptide) pyrophosphoryl-undecaprenol N-acetylglucosamine transferase [Planctomycetota bacterium]
MKPNQYVFAGGGTGGHLYPGLAVAAALVTAEPDAEITFFTTQRALDRKLLEPTGYRQIEQAVQPVTMTPWRWPRFWLSWRQSVAAARTYLAEQRPRAVLGLGGYAAGPPVVAARALGIKTAILNPDAIPGRANRYLARYADLVAAQWDISREFFPPGTNCQTLGCPIRADFAAADPTAGCRRFELDPGRPVLLVTGASQGARTVNRAMQRVWPDFLKNHPDWQLLHLSGPTDEEETRRAYETAGAPARVVAFTHEMWLALAAADAVVSRAGASTLAELTMLGKPAILLPYPYHRDRHQHVNAQVLVDAGAAILLEDHLEPAKNHTPLLTALEQMADDEIHHEMATAATRLGRPQAAADVARWLRN